MKRKVRLFSLIEHLTLLPIAVLQNWGICRAAVLGNQTKFESLKQTLCTQTDLSIPNLKFICPILFLSVNTALVFAVG